MRRVCCEICGKLFEAKNANRKLCGYACRSKKSRDGLVDNRQEWFRITPEQTAAQLRAWR